MPLPGDVGRRAVHRLEHRRELALRIDVGRRRDADGAGAPRGRGRTGCRRTGWSRPPRRTSPGCSTKCAVEDVDVVLVGARRPDSSLAIAAKRSSQYGMVIEMPFDLVAEVRCFFGARAGQLEGDTSGCGRRRWRVKIDSWITISRSVPSIHAAADHGVFALGVLAHDEEVDVAGLAVGERARDAGHQAHGPQVDVLVEVAADRDQQAPQRDVVRHRRPASRRRRGRSRRAARAARASPPASSGRASRSSRSSSRTRCHVEPKPNRCAGGFEHAHALGHDFLADAVARNHGDAVRRLCLPSCSSLVEGGSLLRGASTAAISPRISADRRTLTRGTSPWPREVERLAPSTPPGACANVRRHVDCPRRARRA